jgi:glycosyltransferase involved in cell wall biosynthesis
MRIALVHSFYRVATPSGENHAVMLQAKALEDAGHEVHLIARYSDEAAKDSFYALRSGLSVATGLGPSPLDEIMKIKPDIVHLHNLFPNWSTDWVRHLEIPLVVTVHNFRPMCASGTLLREGKFCELCPTKGSHHAVIHRCYRNSRLATIPLALASRKSQANPILSRANGIVFLSQRSLSQYEQYGFSTRAVTRVIPNFIESTTSPGLLARDSERYGWLFVGRLSEEKGILPLISAWPADVPLHVVGSGPQDSECREEAVEKQITFHGQLPNSNVRELMAQAKGLIFSSICQESSPMVYPEALAAGIPIIALRGNSVADDVEDSGTGIAVDSWNNLREIMGDIENNAITFMRAARKRFEERFRAETWVSNTENVYQVVSKRHRAC